MERQQKSRLLTIICTFIFVSIFVFLIQQNLPSANATTAPLIPINAWFLIIATFLATTTLAIVTLRENKAKSDL